MKLTKIYIGSNNETGILEIDKIKAILNSLGQCSGYTIITGKGYYQGIEENTAIIEIYGGYNSGIIPQLKQDLKQDNILVAEFITEVILK